MVTEAELRSVKARFEQSTHEAERERALTIAQAIDDGWTQKDVITTTGYARETIRRLTTEGRAAREAARIRDGKVKL